MKNHMTKPLNELADDIIEDGIVDADEVIKMRERLYADGIIDREEAEFLFRINDSVSGNKNDPSWNELFVEAITGHLLEDEVSPGEVDEDEAKWLLEKIQADGKIDEIELALLKNLKVKARKLPQSILNLIK